MTMAKPWLAMLAMGVAAMTTSTGASAQEGDSPFHWQPAAEDDAPRPWAIIIPGGGGLAVFHDTDHYYRWARWLNERGIDVLLVDHVALAERPGPEGEVPGDMLARFAAEGLAIARTEGRMDSRCPGVVMGWSFGGEGTLNLAAGGRVQTPGLVGAIAFYPLVAFQPEDYAAQVPVLVLQGEADDTTTLEDLQAFVARAEGGPITAEVYPDGEHGFDAQGLVEAVEWNGGTFQFHAEGAAAATARIDVQLAEWGMTDGMAGCALD